MPRAQDRRALGLELVQQIRIAFARRDLHRERHQQEAAAHGFVDSVQAGLMVAGDEQLEGRIEVEKVLPHEPCGDLVAAR